MFATNRRPVAAPKSRKKLLKQAGSFVGRSQPQPQAFAATPLPVAPLVFGNQANADFSFNSGTMPEGESSLPAAPLVFGNQSNTQFAFTSGTLPEEESLEKMAADMEAELAKYPTPFSNTHDSDDGTLGIDTKMPAAPKVAQGPNFPQYPDPDSTSSLPYFVQDSNIQDPELSRPSSSQGPRSAVDPSFIPGLDIARDSVAETPSFDQNLSFPLDQNPGLANERGNVQPFAASTMPPALSVTQYPDPNVPDTACCFPYFIQDSNAQDSDCPNLPQEPKSKIDPSFLPDSITQNSSFNQEPSFPLDPNLDLANEHGNPKLTAPEVAQYPDLNASDTACSYPCFVQDSNIRDPQLPHPISYQDIKPAVDTNSVPNPKVAQDPSFPLDSNSSFTLDPSLGLSNEYGDLRLIAAFNATPAPDVAKHPRIPEPSSFLFNFVQDSSVQGPELPLQNLPQDLSPAVDPSPIPNFNVAQDLIVQDSSFHQEPSFPFDPSLGLVNQHGNLKHIAAFNATQAPSVAQHPDVPDLSSFLPNFVQNSTVQDQRMPLPSSSQDPNSATDPSFVPNLNVAQDPIVQGPIDQDPMVQDLSLHQEPTFLPGAKSSLANGPGNLKPTAVLNVTQHPNVPDLSSFLPNFVQDSTFEDPGMHLLNLSQYPKPAVDPISSFDPNLNLPQNLFAQHSSLPLDPSLGLANVRGNLKPDAASAGPALTSIQPQPTSENYTDLEQQVQYQDLQSNSAFQINRSDPSRAFDIDPSDFKQNQPLITPGFPNSPSTTPGQNFERNEDSQFDLMDVAPDYKTTPPSWRQNQHTENRFDKLECGGLPENPTNTNPVLAPSHISSSVAFTENPEPLKASEERTSLNKGLDQAQTRNISSEPAIENLKPMRDSMASTVSGFKFKPFAKIAPEPAAHQEMVPKFNAREKRSTIASSAKFFSRLPIPVTSTTQAVAPHTGSLGETLKIQREAIEQHEVEKLRAEIECKNKSISDKDEKIRHSAQVFQDQDKRSMLIIGQLRGDLDDLREEKSALEKANHILAEENSKMRDLQGKAKKNTDLIRKLSGELGNLRKKKSTLEKANEILAKENSEMRANSDKLCQSSLDLKEENRNLSTAVNDLRLLNLKLDEAKENLRAQDFEIQDNTKTIATLNACIDQISPELLWRTEQLREVEDLVLFEESISKWYRDRYYLLWNKNDALESAGDLRDMEIAKLELEKERKHQKEIEALNFQIASLEVENNRLAQRLGEVRGSVDVEEADTVDEKVCDVYDDAWARFTDDL